MMFTAWVGNVPCKGSGAEGLVPSWWWLDPDGLSNIEPTGTGAVRSETWLEEVGQGGVL